MNFSRDGVQKVVRHALFTYESLILPTPHGFVRARAGARCWERA